MSSFCPHGQPANGIMGERNSKITQSIFPRERERGGDGKERKADTHINAHSIYIQYAISIFYYTNLPDDIIPAGNHQND